MRTIPLLRNNRDLIVLGIVLAGGLVQPVSAAQIVSNLKKYDLIKLYQHRSTEKNTEEILNIHLCQQTKKRHILFQRVEVGAKGRGRISKYIIKSNWPIERIAAFAPFTLKYLKVTLSSRCSI